MRGRQNGALLQPGVIPSTAVQWLLYTYSLTDALRPPFRIAPHRVAAARLEPQLAKIAEELHALRPQDGGSGGPSKSETVRDGLIVCYFHSNMRCPTRQSIESQMNETLWWDFASQVGSGEMVWKVVNYEDPATKSLATKFAILMPVVVLARMRNGEIQDWKRLDEVWVNVGDKAAIAGYVKWEVERMLVADRPDSDANAKPGSILVPSESAAGGEGNVAYSGSLAKIKPANSIRRSAELRDAWLP